MRRLRFAVTFLLCLALAAAAFALFRGHAPLITALEPATAVGGNKLLTYSITAPDGVSAVRAYYRQGGKTIELGSQHFAARQWFRAGAAPQLVRYTLQAGKSEHPELADGTAQLVVEAQAANLRGSSSTLSRTLTIRSNPPRISSLGGEVYLSQGGSALTLYQVSKAATESGVEMAGVFFPGYPLQPGTGGTPPATPPAGEQVNFCLFAFPYNAPANSQPQLVARDDAGNQSTAPFPVRTTPKTFHDSTLDISDAFIANTVMPIIENTPSITDQHDPLKNFLLVNHDLRRTDTQELIDAGQKSAPHFLWQGAFRQLGNSKVEASFADHRSYRYHGAIVDQEDHLGFDLAAVRHTPVLAANSGTVVWARYFGIYGNSILIDHGYGLMSLYAHLNDFQVKPGDSVKQGDLIAHSDSTGLAAGDHLHFSMLLDGVQVTPMEWWDPHWIHDRIEAKLQGN